jgi:hypothetical protein
MCYADELETLSDWVSNVDAFGSFTHLKIIFSRIELLVQLLDVVADYCCGSFIYEVLKISAS